MMYGVDIIGRVFHEKILNTTTGRFVRTGKDDQGLMMLILDGLIIISLLLLLLFWLLLFKVPLSLLSSLRFCILVEECDVVVVVVVIAPSVSHFAWYCIFNLPNNR